MTAPEIERPARRKSRQVMVGKVPVGGDAPITVQSMTKPLRLVPRACASIPATSARLTAFVK